MTATSSIVHILGILFWAQNFAIDCFAICITLAMLAVITSKETHHVHQILYMLTHAGSRIVVLRFAVHSVITITHIKTFSNVAEHVRTGILHAFWKTSEEHHLANATRSLPGYCKAECWKHARGHDTCARSGQACFLSGFGRQGICRDERFWVSLFSIKKFASFDQVLV